jgi:hypothetical protein
LGGVTVAPLLTQVPVERQERMPALQSTSQARQAGSPLLRAHGLKHERNNWAQVLPVIWVTGWAADGAASNSIKTSPRKIAVPALRIVSPNVVFDGIIKANGRQQL